LLEKRLITNIKIVFVNACYSENIAKVFQEAGIPIVIAVQSDLKISDDVAQYFSKELYNELLDGANIKDAFIRARNSVKNKFNKKAFTCCCSHHHKQDCLWYKYACKNGFYAAHLAHIAGCESKICEDPERHIHHNSCVWKETFNYEFRINEESDLILESQNDNPLCCCGDKDMKHDESMKFKLLCDEKYKYYRIWNDRCEGEVLDYTNKELEFPKTYYFGREMERSMLVKYLSQRKSNFTHIYGEMTAGKTSFIDHV